MNERDKNQPAGDERAPDTPEPQVKRPYRRPVLCVIGKIIGQIVSNN